MSSCLIFNCLVATVLTACGIETISGSRKLTLHLVATVLTACGIETHPRFNSNSRSFCQLQQYLPLAVLKPIKDVKTKALKIVATVLTACGIETHKCHHLLQCLIVATVLTACGIETHF